MATQRVRPADHTGTQRAKLAAQHAEVVRAREDELSMINAARVEVDNSIQDMVGDRQEKVVGEDGEITYVEAPAVTIRVNSNIEQMTFGAGNHMSFEEGKQYRVSAELAAHLEELGYCWH